MFPLLVSTLGLSYAQVGLAAAVYAIASSVLQPILGYLGDRLVSRWLQTASMALVICLICLVGFARDYLSLLLIVALAGVGSAAFHPQAASRIGLLTDTSRSFSLSIFAFGGYLGHAFGPVLSSNLLDRGGLSSIALLMPVGLAATAYVGWSLGNTGLTEDRVHRSSLEGNPASIPFLLISILLLVTILLSWLQNTLLVYTPLLFTDLTFSGQLLFLLSLGSALGGLLGGVFCGRLGSTPIITGSLLLSAPSILLFINGSGWSAVAAAVAVGALTGASFPIMVAMSQDYLPHHEGVGSGLSMGLAWGIGSLGTLALGAAADTYGLETVLGSLPVVAVLAALIALRLPQARRTSLKKSGV
jgi:FSR family fosmidomycin resistance protein-like MFS transporter